MADNDLDSTIIGTSEKLIIPIGIDNTNSLVSLDLTKSDNCLIDYPGWMRSEQSIINLMVTKILSRNKPQEARFIMCDTNGSDLDKFKDIPHLLTPIITEPERFIAAYNWVYKETKRRIDLFEEVGATTIEDYNNFAGFTAMEYIVCVTTNIQDFIVVAPAKCRELIELSSTNARRTGIIIIASTSRPKDRISKSFNTRFTYIGDQEVGTVDYKQNGSDIYERITQSCKA